MPQAPSAALADIFAFEGTRAIGEPTKYVIQFTHPQDDLSRSEYLNRPAAFVIQPPSRDSWSKPEPARRIQGVVTHFALMSSNRDQSTYQVVLESRLALLRSNPRCRFFLDSSIPEIIRQILRENGFDQLLADFEIMLYREYRKFDFIMQWGEDDLTFITRLCRRSGIWFVCETGEHCERVRFGDDFTHYRREPNLTVAYRHPGGMETSGAESVGALEMHSATIPRRQSVRTYNPERRTPEPLDGSKDIHDDTTTYGETYVWGTPHLNEDEANGEARLRHEAALAAQIEYRGTGDMLDLTPASVLRFANRELPDAKHGLLAVRVMCRASRKKAYHIEFSAIPSDRLYRLPLMEETWPRIEGVITGAIASPGGYKDPYLDDQGRYIVHLHVDRDERTPGLQSCPMRLAKPFAGAGQSGFHFGLVEGTVVTVGFLWGNPDLPYISQVLHTADATDPVVSGYPWGTRNTIRTRTNNTLEMDDRDGREHIKVATEHGKTQLNLGYTVDRNNKGRGEGFELRTDQKGHVRAGGGMLVSADAQPVARGHQTDMAPATDQFRLTQAQAQELTDVARAAHAEMADVKAENQWLKDELAGLKQAVIALSAPNGIGLATPDRVLVSAGKDVSVATSSRFNVNAMANVVIAAGEVLSLFAHRLGIKLFAARGKVQIQAQSDEISIASEKDTIITSTKGRVVIEAKEELLFKCGGSYFRMTGNGIEDATPGDRKWRAAAYDRSGPASMPADLPVLPVPAETECALRASRAGMPFARM
ncbi:type VI secretion system tip protein VgrG [Paraburkholderia sprentiae WSM5005]|uniref:Type VI secretion system tip protein VgrG n=1 Tax=Paraburkholderia sprentiae WSM5005 TaxID=754502 RepID=A0A1I9YRF9_9BURK|nr:type VI secretion system Vgr family protein [Paraburkholderia sprentiae]APA88789.2 type VI secretion system tip protein VgrG [Paraburkholderia sprentiae WSM5005]